jgi:DNA-binding NarL/FixJ family response regulator
VFISDTEREILRGLANGHRSRSIANAIERSEPTVELYIKDLLLKFRARSRAQLVATALREGVLNLEDIEDS